MFSVAIDGPAGAGKSTIAKLVAKKLNFIYVDTGALYRAIGLYALKKGIDPQDKLLITPLLIEININLQFKNGEQKVIMNGEDVSSSIRTPEASMAASAVSAIPSVREFLFSLQRNIAKNSNVIMDGRDIGTVILPNANVKIFLTAAAHERALRRYNELKQKGIELNFDDVLKDIEERDYNDSHRSIAPLKPAADAILIDTTDLNLEQSAEKIELLIKEKLNNEVR